MLADAQVVLLERQVLDRGLHRVIAIARPEAGAAVHAFVEALEMP